MRAFSICMSILSDLLTKCRLYSTHAGYSALLCYLVGFDGKHPSTPHTCGVLWLNLNRGGRHITGHHRTSQDITGHPATVAVPGRRRAYITL